jgi:hypothetical protein
MQGLCKAHQFNTFHSIFECKAPNFSYWTDFIFIGTRVTVLVC